MKRDITKMMHCGGLCEVDCGRCEVFIRGGRYIGADWTCIVDLMFLWALPFQETLWMASPRFTPCRASGSTEAISLISHPFIQCVWQVCATHATPPRTLPAFWTRTCRAVVVGSQSGVVAMNVEPRFARFPIKNIYRKNVALPTRSKDGYEAPDDPA
jgi:hypothetical protein